MKKSWGGGARVRYQISNNDRHESRKKHPTNLTIKAMLQRNNIRMSILHQLSHNLQLPILKPLILQNLFNSHDFTSFNNRCLKYHAERSVADDSFGGVGNGLFCRGGRVVVCDCWWIIGRCVRRSGGGGRDGSATSGAISPSCRGSGVSSSSPHDIGRGRRLFRQ